MRIKRIFGISIILGLFTLTGCQPLLQQQAQQRIMAADQQFAAAKEACTNGKLTKHNAVERADCIGKARIQSAIDSDFPAVWLIEQRVAADRESAIAYSKGIITEQEYDTARQHHAEAVREFIAAKAQQESQQQTFAPLPLMTIPAYSPVLNTQPSMPPVSAPVENGLMNSYQQESQRPNPYNGVGAQGYNGTTYIPAGADPNLPPNVMR